MIKKTKEVIATGLSKPISWWSEHKIRGKQMAEIMPKKYPKLRQATPEYIKAYDEESKKISKARKLKESQKLYIKKMKEV